MEHRRSRKRGQVIRGKGWPNYYAKKEHNMVKKENGKLRSYRDIKARSYDRSKKGKWKEVKWRKGN